MWKKPPFILGPLADRPNMGGMDTPLGRIPSRFPASPAASRPSNWLPGPGWFSGASKPKQGLYLSYPGRNQRKANSGRGCLGPRPAGGGEGSRGPLSHPHRKMPPCQQHRGASHYLSRGTTGAFPWDYLISDSYRIFKNPFSYQIMSLPIWGQFRHMLRKSSSKQFVSMCHLQKPLIPSLRSSFHLYF